MKYCVDYTITNEITTEDCPVSDYIIIEADTVTEVLLELIVIYNEGDDRLHSVQAIYQLGEQVMEPHRTPR